MRIREIKERLSNIKQDSIRGQLLINFIDKVVIGGIVGIIALCITITLKEEEKKRDIALQEEQQLKELNFSVAEIQTGILIKQRDSLIEQMGNYLKLVRRMQNSMSSRVISEEDQKKVMGLTYDIDIIAFNIETVFKGKNDIDESDILKKKELFVDSLKSLHAKLITDKMPSKKEIDKKLTDIKEKYQKVIIEINNVISEILKKEFKNSRQLEKIQ